MSSRRLALCGIVASLFVLMPGAPALEAADPHVDIVVGADPPSVVRFAADELAGQMQRLFQADTSIVAQRPAHAGNCILLGSPEKNPAIPGDAWPQPSDQGIVLRSIKAKNGSALVGGGSPEATLWAVYELGHRWGIRYVLSGDVDPPRPPKLDLSSFDVTLEPTFRERTWIVQDDSAVGACAWPAADYQRLIEQLAKLKINRLRIVLDGHVPFVDDSLGQNATLFDGETFPMTTDSAGRKAFKGAKAFTNSDFAGANTPAEVRTRSEASLRSLAEQAAKLGMTIALTTDASSDGTRNCRLLLSVDTVGVLPQNHLTQVHAQLAAARDMGQQAWSAWCRTPSETDPVLHYLCRASFDKSATPDAAVQDLYGAMGGREDFVGRMKLCWTLLEQASDQVEQTLPGVAAPRADAALARYRAKDPAAVDVKALIDLYTRSTNELYRGLNSSEKGAHTLVYYQSKRGEFAINYLTGVEALDAAGTARRKGDKEAQCEQLEKAVEAFYNAFDALATVARDPSDRAVIAVGNKYLYEPLVKELEHVTAE